MLLRRVCAPRSGVANAPGTPGIQHVMQQMSSGHVCCVTAASIPSIRYAFPTPPLRSFRGHGAPRGRARGKLQCRAHRRRRWAHAPRPQPDDHVAARQRSSRAVVKSPLRRDGQHCVCEALVVSRLVVHLRADPHPQAAAQKLDGHLDAVLVVQQVLGRAGGCGWAGGHGCAMNGWATIADA